MAVLKSLLNAVYKKKNFGTKSYYIVWKSEKQEYLIHICRFDSKLAELNVRIHLPPTPSPSLHSKF